jgi:hypothetical protein
LAEQRERGYPVRPFVTVRLPTLAMLHAGIGIDGARWLGIALLLAAAFLLHRRLSAHTTLTERAAAVMLLVVGGAGVAMPVAGLIHELFAGLFLAIAWAAHRPRRYALSLIALAAALAFRELTLPFALLWLLLAAMRQSWREAAAVGAVIALFAGAMALHFLAVEAQIVAGDPASGGWGGMAGVALPIAALSQLTILAMLPPALAAPLALFPLIGWLGSPGRSGLFAFLWFAGYFAAIALFARPDNFYWMQLALPLYLAGFAFAPRALADLAAAAGQRRKPPIPVPPRDTGPAVTRS